MRRMIAAAALLCVCLPWTPARAETLLHLSDTETVTAVPDELAATLRAEATSASPADAQRRVNAAMAAALAQARKVSGLTISTGAYSVWHINPTPQDHADHWQASQTLDLSGDDGGTLLTLVGALQHAGMAIESLNWRLSRDAEHKAHEQALRAAIAALRGRANQAAGLLDLRFDSFKEVRLGQAAPPPLPRFAGAMNMAMSAATPPSAVAADVPVSATVEADAILVPK